MDWLELVYLGSALIGGTFFVLRILTLIFTGFDFGVSHIPTDFDTDAMAGLDLAGDLDSHVDFQGDIDHTSSMLSFKFLSLQGLTAFFMMFGLVGLAIHRARIWAIFSIAGGVLAGLVTVWAIGMIFTLMRGLQSEGNIDLKNAIGKQGTVYLTIPEIGSGQVQVTVQGSLKVLDAVSDNNHKILTKEKIVVIDTLDEHTVLVKKI